jgi:hypothetical protein
VEVISRDVPVISHAMMSAAAGQKVPIIKPQVESLLQRFNVMHRQLLIQPWHSEDAVASLVANPAKMEVTPYDLFPLFLPGMRLAESRRLTVAVLRLLRLLRADVSSRMDSPAILTRFQHLTIS